MSLAFRRFLYITFILIFFTVTPLIIIYASGYKFGNGFKLQKTGALIIDTLPKGATITLDGKTEASFFENILRRTENVVKSPAKIKNLIPAEYQVGLELEGYWPWAKKLWVNPNESTYLEDVVLFKKALPLNISLGQYDQIMADRKNNFLAAIGQNNFNLIDLDADSSIFGATTTLAEPALWSPDSSRIAIGKKVYDLDSQAALAATENFFTGQVKKIAWGENNGSVYYLNEDGISLIDLEKHEQTKIIASTSIADFYSKNSALIYVAKNQSAYELDIIQPASLKNTFKLELPAADYEFINTDHALINLLDKTHNELYLIDQDSPFKPVYDTIENIKKAVWMDANSLFYANDSEIWMYDRNNGNKKLLTRISNEIKSILVHPSKNYIIYSTDQTINVLELDDREKYNITKLIELEKIDGLYINPDGSALYFFAAIGQQSGLYKLELE